MKYEAISSMEELVLLSIVALESDAYAYAIKEEIRIQTGRSPALGTIHTILYRMENKGFVKSDLGGSSAKRGGRSKRLFTLTNRGLEIIREIQSSREALWNKISLT